MRTKIVFGGSHLLYPYGAGSGRDLHHLPVAGLHIRLREETRDDLARAVVPAALPAGVQNAARAHHAVTSDVLRTDGETQLAGPTIDGCRD